MRGRHPQNPASRRKTNKAILLAKLHTMNRSPRFGIVALSLLFIHAGLLAWGDLRHSPTIDEVGHLAAGIAHWQDGRFDPYAVNPPLVRMVAALPVLACHPIIDWKSYRPDYRIRNEFTVGAALMAANGEGSFWFFTLARWACIPFSLLGAYVCWRWAGELYGQSAGLLALALWCFDPNILGNAQMITPDTGAAAIGVTAHYALWLWLKHPDRRGMILAGLTLGLAELTKTTWILLFALWPLLWLAWRWPERRTLNPRIWLLQGGQLSVILLLGLFIINVGYGFEGSFRKLSSYSFASKTLSGQTDASPAPHERANRFAGCVIGEIPAPVPHAYLLGIDYVRSEFETGYPSYLRCEWKHGGWWYYYLYGLVVKAPLGLWVLALLALALALGNRAYSASWRDEMVLLAPALAVFTLVSSQTGFNHHLRYVLPSFPFAFILISRLGRVLAFKAKAAAVVAGIALTWLVASSLSVYPHSLSYFNELVGGPAGGGAHLIDSNVDWGQDLLYLREWLQAHPEAKPLGLAYFGSFDPHIAGIEYTQAPPGPAPVAGNPESEPLSCGPRPGWYAVSVTLVYGHRIRVFDGHGCNKGLEQPDYAYFQRFQPIARAGYSINIYYITHEEANRVRKALSLPLLPPTFCSWPAAPIRE